ncbi:MAG: NADPH:quinone reductase [Acidimicrobiaceae bacterium]|nr:NADPH:quinone reductase [Acidimicrobiaceae bacterium]
MKAWRVHKYGEPIDVLVLDDVAEPTAKDLAGLGMGMGGWEPLQPGAEPFTDWVIMRMSAAALALPDVTMARGTYPVPVGMPYISGQEGVGVVIDAAPAHRELIGQRVAAVCIQPFGSLAPIAVGVSSLFPVPDSLSDEDAAAYVIAGHTAYHAAIRRGKVSAGETVLITGAAGGVGSAAVQICVAAGARVLALVGGPEKAAFVKALGAEPIDHQSTDVVTEARKLTHGRGVDVIVDPVQGEMVETIRGALVIDGRHVLCGHAGGLFKHDPHFYVLNHTLVGATLGGYSRPEMKRIQDETHEVLTKLIAEGKYRPLVTRTVAFGDVPKAVDDLANRRTMGRVIVTI